MASELETLFRTARTLGRRAGVRKGRTQKPPALVFVTDPARTPDPARIMADLPKGTGVIYRAFGAPDALATGRRLAAIARRRGLVFLIGADEALAAAVNADGLHLPERMVSRAPRIRARRPTWLITVAAHSEAALRRAARAGADATLLSPVFPSRSSSAGRPLGPVRTAATVRRARIPVIALGGISARTARRAAATGASGFAAVEAFATRNQA